jgi:hypothetical protein
VTFEPGSIDNPARDAIIVNCVVGVKSPRNCRYTSATMTREITNNANPAVFNGGVRGLFNGDVIAATP